MSIEGGTAVVQLIYGCHMFIIVCAKSQRSSQLSFIIQTAKDVHVTRGPDELALFKVKKDEEDWDTDETETEDMKLVRDKAKRGSKKEVQLKESHRDELKGPIDDIYFRKIKLSYIYGSLRIYISSFVDKLKNIDEKLRQKTRLVAQKYTD